MAKTIKSRIDGVRRMIAQKPYNQFTSLRHVMQLADIPSGTLPEELTESQMERVEDYARSMMSVVDNAVNKLKS